MSDPWLKGPQPCHAAAAMTPVRSCACTVARSTRTLAVSIIDDAPSRMAAILSIADRRRMGWGTTRSPLQVAHPPPADQQAPTTSSHAKTEARRRRGRVNPLRLEPSPRFLLARCSDRPCRSSPSDHRPRRERPCLRSHPPCRIAAESGSIRRPGCSPSGRPF